MQDKLPNQRYLDLARKWTEGTITDEERTEYINWLRENEPDAVLEVPEELATDKSSHKEIIYNRIREQIAFESGDQHAQYPFRKILKVAAVFTGLLLSGYLGYLYFNGNEQKPSVTAVKPTPSKITDIEPGSNGAILTLSNGKVIVLDTASNGALGSNVMKQTEAIVFADDKDANGAVAAGDPIEYNTLTTPRARQQQIILPDGSKIWLNAQSSIRFPTRFAGSSRPVEITGEVYFEVSPDKSKPFVVNIGRSSVNVLGTHFNVMAYAGEKFLETTLLEGKVQFRNDEKVLELNPGQQSKLNNEGQLRLASDPDLDLVMAWKNGFQSFKSTDLKTILRQAERWYDVDVEYSSDIPPGITFSGEVPREVTLLQLLKALESKQLKFELDAPHKVLKVSYQAQT